MIGPTALVAPFNRVSAQTIQLYPIRSAPLGSPAGTVGDPVTPTFNDALDCWELKVPGGVEVDIDVEAGGWGNFGGGLALGSVQVTIESAGYSNGVGADLNPKGWPDDPEEGAYQATKVCGAGGNGDPAVPPFDRLCTGNGFPIDNPNWIFRPYMNAYYLAAIATSTLNYGYAVAAQNVSNTYDPDPDSFGTFGGLILEVPTDAAGTYVISINPDSNSSFFDSGLAAPLPAMFTAACITVIEGACCLDTDSDGYRDSCQDDGSQSECLAADGLFLADALPCTGVAGTCILDGDGDGIADICRTMDADCCDAQGGSFLGTGVSCLGVEGACCVDVNADGVGDTCRVVDGTNCDVLQGSFLGGDTECDNARGACTFDSDGDGFQDTCHVMDQSCCDERSGTFRGDGSQCSEVLGACCLDFDRVCLEIDLTSCVEQHGRFQGFGISCSGDADGDGKDDACGDVIPALSEWGLIAMALLLLVGIKIFFARRLPESRT